MSTSPRRAGLHHLLDRILDARPDLEDTLQRVLRSAVDMAQTPGVRFQIELVNAARHLFDALGRRPPGPPGGGFTATPR